MIAARDLARKGVDVTLLEGSTQLGGKAQAFDIGGDRVEHGYHVFPTWYDNIRALLDELNIDLIDFDRYHYVRKGEFPKKVTVRGPSGIGAILHDTFNGLLPWYHTTLFGYSVIDMLSRPLRHKSLLDRISQNGLMRSAWYMTRSVAELNQENVLKASAIPACEMSAMTAKNVASLWVKRANPFLSVLDGDLQTAFIQPIADSVIAAGVKVVFNAKVAGLRIDGGKVVAAHTSAGEHTADTFVVTTPLEVTREFITDDIYDLDPSLGSLSHLEADPMSALHIYFTETLPDIPREHVFLHGGNYGLSFIDVSQIWSGYPNTVLSFIASHFVPLTHVSEADAKEHILSEIEEYLPIDRSKISKMELRSNVDTPLFINTVGAWGNRSRATTRIDNLYMAGDWVKNDADLACMEGAVRSALQAVKAIRDESGHNDAPGPIAATKYPRLLFVILRWAMIPFIALTYLIARFMELLKK
jgi:phytoene dehydrogenase-like protein